MVDVSEDAKSEFRVLEQYLAVWHIVAEMRRDEIVVFQHLLDQGAYFLAPFDTGVLLENPATFR
jgi:hypothetical protein